MRAYKLFQMSHTLEVTLAFWTYSRNLYKLSSEWIIIKSTILANALMKIIHLKIQKRENDNS